MTERSLVHTLEIDDLVKEFRRARRARKWALNAMKNSVERLREKNINLDYKVFDTILAQMESSDMIVEDSLYKAEETLCKLERAFELADQEGAIRVSNDVIS